MEQFNIPVVLFCFKRTDTTKRVLEAIRKVQPRKMYILADQGRTAQEKEMAAACRNMVESEIDWPCEVIKNYAAENRGVYKNIGLGAKWVFEREAEAIFLEDDCLPDITFFSYCKQLLEHYRENEKVLWICGTNYLGEYHNANQDDYMFTSHLLPCGWASWSKKFLKYYDAEFNLYTPEYLKIAQKTYDVPALFRQQKRSIESEINAFKRRGVPTSWDFQMILSLRANGMYGISPSGNLIRNIGADENSTHGGTSLNKVMTKRFCEVPLHSVPVQLKYVDEICVDPEYERKISKIILYPLTMRIDFFAKRNIGALIRKAFRIDPDIRISNWIGAKFHA